MKRTTIAAVSGGFALAFLALCTGPGMAQTGVGVGVGVGTGTGVATSNSNSGAASESNSLSGALSTQGQSVKITSIIPANQTIKNVPNVYAPGLAAAGSEVCLGSMSVGGAGAGFGLTVGGTLVDRECQLRLNAKTLAVLGYTAAARETMCLDDDVRKAMLAAGTPCSVDRAPRAMAYEAAAAPRQSSTRVARADAPKAEAARAEAPPAAAGQHCRKEYQLIGGWYDVCN